MHKIAILPTLLTLGNAVCGLASITYASQIRFDSTPEAEAHASLFLLLSGGLILAAMIFDALDGFVARLSKSSSEFGKQLDSLCDGISFGVAPAFLLIQLAQEVNHQVVHRAVMVIAALYLSCTLLRLARFNLESTPDPANHKRFKGLPSPAAAGCVASLALLCARTAYTRAGLDEVMVRWLAKGFAPLGTLVVALLMVSRFPYPHFTKQLLRRRRRLSTVVQAMLAVAIIVLFQELALFVMFWAYALHAPVRYLVLRALRHNTLPAHSARLD